MQRSLIRTASTHIMVLMGILAGSGFVTAAQAATLGTLCEACSSTQRVHSAETRGLAFPGNFGSGIVWVGDFPNEVIEKYYVFKEDMSLSPQQPYDLDEALLRNGVKSTEVLEVYEPITDGAISATAVRLQTTAEESSQIALVIDVVNHVLRPIGSGYPIALGSALDRYADTAVRSGPQPTVGSFQVPSQLGDSAYTLIGNSASALQLGAQMQQRHSILLNAVQTGSIIQAVINLPINTAFAATFEFADGSRGDWFIDQRGELRADFTTFEDSENNPIPYRSADVDGNVFNFRDGRESRNFQNMATRVQILGISMRDAGGGSGSCRFSCNSDSCTVTCSAN